ncbi:hypothetical protein KCU76_g2070, partial [Aureobasidium melanogenum]
MADAMPLRSIHYSGPFDLPTPPSDQQSASFHTRDPDILAIFNAPPTHSINPEEEVRYQWGIREARLRRSHEVLTADIRDLAVLPEDIVVPAAILKWMAGFEEWLRKSFLHVLFSDPYDATDTERWISATSDPDRSDLILQFVDLWDQIFTAMRKFLIDIHYTNTIDLTGDTLRPYTDYEIYVKPTKLLITPFNKDYCSAMSPLDEHKLAWWDHRSMLLQRGATKREGVAWLLQVREEMDEMARRYPDAKALLRRPFMMPALQFR